MIEKISKFNLLKLLFNAAPHSPIVFL